MYQITLMLSCVYFAAVKPYGGTVTERGTCDCEGRKHHKKEYAGKKSLGCKFRKRNSNEKGRVY